MLRSTFLVRFATVASLTACGASGPPPATPLPAAEPPAVAPARAGAPPDAGPFAPTPYTARQLREATRVGRTYTYAIESAGEPRRRQTLTFIKVGDDGLETQSVVSDESGAELKPPKTSRSTWEELRKHAEFRREEVTIGEDTVVLPAGSFDCLVYTVRKGGGPSGEVSRFYFAKSLPGAPVFFTTDKGGVRVYTQQLLEHRPGG